MAVNWSSLGSAILGGGSPNAKGGTNFAKSGMDLLMGMLANKGQEDQQRYISDRNQNWNQQSAVGDIYKNRADEQLQRDFAVAGRAQLGWDQNYLQKQMAKNIAMQQLMGGFKAFVPTNEKVKAKLDAVGYKPFVPQFQDGWGMDIFSRDAAQAALANEQNIQSMLGKGTNPLANWATPQNQQYAQYAQTNDRAALQNAIDGVTKQYTQPQQPEKKSGFWGKLGGALKFAAPIAASFIPGVGPALGAAIAGIGSAAGSKMQGNSWGNALGAGALGAAGGYLGNKMMPGKPAAPAQIGQAATGQAQSALGNAIDGMSNFYTGQFKLPQGQLNLPSKQYPWQTAGGFTGFQLPQNPTSMYRG